MLSLTDIRNDNRLLNEIDWEMTPEEAVTRYLEWGNNWSHGEMVKSVDEASLYFVVNTWGERPVIYLIRRTMAGAEELAVIEPPEELGRWYIAAGGRRAIWALEGELRDWLRDKLGLEAWDRAA